MQWGRNLMSLYLQGLYVLRVNLFLNNVHKCSEGSQPRLSTCLCGVVLAWHWATTDFFFSCLTPPEFSLYNSCFPDCPKLNFASWLCLVLCTPMFPELLKVTQFSQKSGRYNDFCLVFPLCDPSPL